METSRIIATWIVLTAFGVLLFAISLTCGQMTP